MIAAQVAVVGGRKAFELVGKREGEVGDRLFKPVPVPITGKLFGIENAARALLVGMVHSEGDPLTKHPDDSRRSAARRCFMVRETNRFGLSVPIRHTNINGTIGNVSVYFDTCFCQ
jgi:hypothetical protein